ncbi:MAG: hypothetical protein IJR07_10900 [Bacteroidaceae bacterium]|nr:hypothetical protein [Bacteroidaceae bacterium]
MKENKEKRVLRVELDNEVKKVSITGVNSDEKVVMRQELSEEDLEQATGGIFRTDPDHHSQRVVCYSHA